MALIFALLVPLFQLAQITVKINPYAKSDKNGEYMTGIFLRQKSRGGKVIVNKGFCFIPLSSY